MAFRSARGALAVAATLVVVGPSLARAQTLDRTEQRIRDWVHEHRADELALLRRAVDIRSATLDTVGVRAVGSLFADELRALGFTTRWVAMPPSMHRAGHLVAERRGRRGKRILLIGHLDTVVEGTGFTPVDSLTANGNGTSDMKGGDVAIVYALRALAAQHALDDATITVVMTGDEEAAGDPLTLARRDLIDAAKQSDVALAFEGGTATHATVARRGASTWLLHVTGKQGHTAGIFTEGAGYGAAFEMARILDAFRTRLAGQPNLTFSPSVVVAGTDVAYDTLQVAGSAASKLNIIARSAVVSGDLRFLSDGQKDSARAVMREIVGQSLPGTSAQITFADEYPAMSPTAGNYALLAMYDSASQALGYGKVEALEPGRRGAGDVSFVAAYLDALDGLGVDGRGAHTPDESVKLPSVEMATSRAAVLIRRLIRQPRPAPRTASR